MSFYNITEIVNKIVYASGIWQGLCIVYTHHTTCSVFTQKSSLDKTYNGVEFLQQDMLEFLERLLPTCRKENQYMHPGILAVDFAAKHDESKPESLNTDGHLRSSILRRSVSIPVIDGEIDLNNLARIYFGDFDQNRSRTREIKVCVIGNPRE